MSATPCCIIHLGLGPFRRVIPVTRRDRCSNSFTRLRYVLAEAEHEDEPDGGLGNRQVKGSLLVLTLRVESYHENERSKEVAKSLCLHVPSEIVFRLQLFLSLFALSARNYNDRSDQAGPKTVHKSSQEAQGHEVRVVCQVRHKPEGKASRHNEQERQLDGPLCAESANTWLREAASDELSRDRGCQKDPDLIALDLRVVIVANERD